MLVMTRGVGSEVIVRSKEHPELTLTLKMMGFRGNQVRIGIEAAKSLEIVSEEAPVAKKGNAARIEG